MLKYILILIFALPIAMAAQMTYVPDDNFEQALIDLGYDTPPLNDSVPTANIKYVTRLYLYSKNIANLTGIEDFYSLEQLSCASNQIEQIDLTKNPFLIELNCSNNKIQYLNLSNNYKLSTLYCSFNQIDTLNLINNISLIALDCNNNKISKLDLSQNWVLIIIKCYNNSLTHLNIKSGYNENIGLNASGNLNATNNPDLLCIQVDNPSLAENYMNFNKDPWAHYSTNCNYTGVENELNFHNPASVFPNPASDFVEFDLNFVGEAVIYNLFGEIEVSTKTEGDKYRIDISGLAAGVYFIRVGDRVQKFIKY